MLDERRLRWRNPATWYAAVGFVLIAITLWLPWFTASRTARVEHRADQLAELCLVAAGSMELPADDATLAHFFARWLRLADAAGVFTGDLEPLPSEGDGIALFANKHYLFQLAGSPPPALATATPDLPAPLEVVAWPASAAGPGHSAFFHPAGAGRAFTRNLTRNYHGFKLRPAPGCGHRRLGPSNESLLAYRGQDDERWTLY